MGASIPAETPGELRLSHLGQRALRCITASLAANVSVGPFADTNGFMYRCIHRRRHETQADHVRPSAKASITPDRCFSPDVVVYPCRQEARLLTVLASNIAHGKDRIVVDAAFST
jgi:hypothetical protein